MIKRLLIVLLLLAPFAVGQSTTVSATVVDSSSQVWANGTYTISFRPVPNQPGPYRWNGAPLTTTQFTGTMNGSGVFSVSIPSSDAITPAKSQWTITVCPSAASPCGTIFLPITGSSEDVSAQITAAIPPVHAFPTPMGYAYADSQVQQLPGLGQSYFNTTQKVPKYWDGSAWQTYGSGNGTIQPTPQFRLFIQPNAGTQAVAGPAVIGTNAVAPILQNQYNANLYQTSPGSNDGIANAIAAAGANGTSFAPSDYSTTETALFPAPLNASFLDYRSGTPNLWVHNPTGSNAASTYGFFGPNPTRNCLFDGALGDTAPANGTNCKGTDSIFLGPGTAVGSGLISNDLMQDDIATSYRIGITEGHAFFLNCFKTSDCAHYKYVQYVPGWVDPADEGVKNGLQMLEATNMFTGTVATVNAASVKITPTSAGSGLNAGGNGQYPGGMLLDLTQVADSGTVTAITQASGNTPGTFTTSATHTASTVWGVTTTTIPDPTTVSITAWSIASNVATLTATNGLASGQTIVLHSFDANASFFNGVPVTVLSTGLSSTQFEFNFTHANASGTDTGQATTQPYGQMEQFSISDTNGTFSVGDQVCIAGTVHGEETTVATVSGSGTQTVTARVSYPSDIGAFIVKGACRAITFSADFVSGVADPPYLIVGAPDTTHYWWANYSQNPGRYSSGPLAAFNNRSVLPVSIPQEAGVAVTRTSNVVTMPLNPASAGVQLAWLNNHAGAVVSGCADSSFNGTVTPTVIVSPAEGGTASITYANAGANNFTSGCSVELPTTLAAYHVYPMAWVVDVVDPAVAGTTAYFKSPLTAVDGYLALARNSVAWAVGDTVEEPHLPAAEVSDDSTIAIQNSPSPSGVGSVGIDHSFGGTGNTGSYRPLWLHQTTSLPFTMFQGLGGDLPPIQNYSILSGAYSTMFNLPFAPIANGSVMTVQCPPSAGDDPGNEGTNCSSPNYYAQFQNLGSSGTSGLYFQPSTNTYELHATAVHLPVASLTANSIGLNGLDSGGFQIADPAILTQARNHNYSSWGSGTTADSSAQIGAGTYAAGEIVVGAEIPTPVQVQNFGTAGTTTYTYVCTANTAQGETLPSASVGTATGNATLSGSNYNQVACKGNVGTQSMNVYRTSTTGGLSAGKICSNVPVNYVGELCNDTGQAAGAAVPTVDTSGKLLLSGVTITGNPTTGQLLTATSPTAATWQNPASGIANVQIVLPVTALAANTCSSVITTTMTGVTTTSTFTSSFASDASGVTGYGSSGGLSIVMWPTANTNNLKLCNPTASSITPGAMTINVGVR